MKNLSKALIEHIQNLNEFENKYVQLKCVNYTDEKTREGAFSIVFKATDTFSNKPVAIKFYDPATKNMDAYRINAFKREADLVQQISGKNRCLELIDPISAYGLPVKSDYGPIEIPTSYFVTEWIERNINDYFYDSESVSVVERLYIFRAILLAVNALHNTDIYHRDLKVDNIRLKRDDNNSFCVIIDFGTAALVDSGNIARISEYNHNKGAPAYTPPEGLFGLSCERSLGKSGDFYALGALLFELFNPKLFLDKCYLRYQHVHMNFAQVTTHQDAELRKSEYFKVLNKVDTKDMFRYDYTDFRSVPTGVRNLLIELQKKLVTFDCRKRLASKTKVLRRIDIIIKCLTHEEKQRQLRERRQLYKENRLRKLQHRDERLSAYMKNQKLVAANVRS